MHQRTIVRSLHVADRDANDALLAPLTVPSATNVQWPEGFGCLVGGVSSFGFGGSNAHVVLSEPRLGEAQKRASLAPRTTLKVGALFVRAVVLLLCCCAIVCVVVVLLCASQRLHAN